MARVSYKYVDIKHKRGITFVSRALGIGYSLIGVYGLVYLIRGGIRIGLGMLGIALIIFIISRVFNYYAIKTADKYYSSHPEAVFELFYDEEKTKLGLAYNAGELTREELDARMAELEELKARFEASLDHEGIDGKPAVMIPEEKNSDDEDTLRENSIIPNDVYTDDEGDEETFFLDDGDDETMILEGDADDEKTLDLLAFEKPKPVLHLIRCSDDECMDFTSPLFTIGSSPSKADYAVTSNKRVSRKHATIFLNDEDFFIKDNSKNGTFVNDEKLDADQSVMLKEGDTVRLADEAFIVHLDQGELTQ